MKTDIRFIKLYIIVILELIISSCVSNSSSLKNEIHSPSARDQEILQNADSGLLKDLVMIDETLLLSTVFRRLGYADGNEGVVVAGGGANLEIWAIYDVSYKGMRLLIEFEGYWLPTSGNQLSAPPFGVSPYVSFLTIYYPTKEQDIYENKPWCWRDGEIKPYESSKKKYVIGGDGPFYLK